MHTSKRQKVNRIQEYETQSYAMRFSNVVIMNFFPFSIFFCVYSFIHKGFCFWWCFFFQRKLEFQLIFILAPRNGPTHGLSSLTLCILCFSDDFCHCICVVKYRSLYFLTKILLSPLHNAYRWSYIDSGYRNPRNNQRSLIRYSIRFCKKRDRS